MRSSDSVEELRVFVRTDKVRAGDVLLSRDRSIISELIALGSRGDYSHAAIWLAGPATEGSIMLAESDELGVGWTPLAMSAHTNAVGQPEVLLLLPGNLSRYKLLRHPGIADVPPARLAAVAEKVRTNAFARSYPELSRLLSASKLPAAVRTAVGHLLRVKRVLDRDPPKLHAGAFCSELVATCFAELGLPLFSSERAPESISPGDFATPDCLLTEVADAFVTEREVPEVAANLRGFEGIGREDLLPPMVTLRELCAQMSKARSMLEAQLAAELGELGWSCKRALTRAQARLFLRAFRQQRARGMSPAKESEMRSQWAKVLDEMHAIDAVRPRPNQLRVPA